VFVSWDMATPPMVDAKKLAFDAKKVAWGDYLSTGGRRGYEGLRIDKYEVLRILTP